MSLRLVSNSIFVIVAIGFATATINGQKNLDVCRVVATRWTPIHQAMASSEVHDFEKFAVDDASGWKITREFRYETDGKVFVIEAEVAYFKDSKPPRIEIGLFVNDNEISSRSPLQFVTAGTTYRHKWGKIFVSKPMEDGDFIYEFRLLCADGISKNMMHRDEVKTSKTDRH